MYVRKTEREAGDNSQLLRFPHLQLPNCPYRQDDDKKVSDDVRHDDALQDQDLVHAVADSHHCPLLRDRVAEKDEDESEGQSPDNDNAGNDIDYLAELQRERPVVKPKLAEFQTRQCPKVDQREGESHFQDVL